MDKLEESEAARLEEKKEAEYKPVVMGKCLTDYRHGQPIPDSHSTMRVQIRLPMSVYFVFQYIYVICCEKREARRPNHRKYLVSGVIWLFGRYSVRSQPADT